MFFTSKKDIFYFLIIWGTIVLMLILVIFNFSLSVGSVFANLFVLSFAGFLTWIWFGTNYRIGNEYIEIKYGPFKEKFSIQNINKIGKKKSVLIAPSLAIDKVLLQYGRYGKILVSPKKEKEFIDLLLTKNHRIMLEKTLFKI